MDDWENSAEWTQWNEMEEKHVMKKIINFVAAGGIAAAPSLAN